MTLTEARELFARRYYVWCAEQVRLEVGNEFPFVRKVRDGNALTYLAQAVSLPPKDRHAFAQALLKWRLRSILPGIGVDFSEQEKTTAQKFGESLAWAKPDARRDYEERAAHTAEFRIDRSKLWQLTKLELSEIFPSGFRQFGPNVWRNEETRGSLKITTYVDLGGRSRQLGYSHSIGLSVDQPLWEPQISVLT